MQLIRSSSVVMPGKSWSIIDRLLPYRLIILLLLILSTMFVGDAITTWRPGGTLNLYWSLLDSPVHAVIALLVLSPLIIRKSARETYKVILIAGLAVVFLDLDHVVAASSFSLYNITHLPARPDTHSLLFAVVCGWLAYILTRRGTDGWLIFGVLASHILRDASTGNTPYLWPLSVNSLSIPVSYALQIGLFLLTIAITQLRNPFKQPSKLINIEHELREQQLETTVTSVV